MIRTARKFIYILLIVFTAGMSTSLHASTEVAFGFFRNESRNPGLNYLETILPNSFASSLKNRHNIATIKPGKLSEIFKEHDLKLNKNFSETDLPAVSGLIDAEYFVFGSFTPKGSDRIELKINIYRTGSTRIFTFTESGYLETEIFKLVDRISKQIKNITGDSMLYRSEKVRNRSRIAILTNIEGSDLNNLYYEFLARGYKLSQFQGNSLSTAVTDENIEKFYHISTRDVSYRILADKKTVKLFHGTWAGVDYTRVLKRTRSVYNKYAFDFINTKEGMIKRMKNSGSIDYLLIVGFDSGRDKAWIRCINMGKNRLILTKSEIEDSSINGIGKKIIASMMSLPEAED